MTKDQVKCANENDDEIGLLETIRPPVADLFFEVVDSSSGDREDSPAKRMTSYRGGKSLPNFFADAYRLKIADYPIDYLRKYFICSSARKR